MGFSFWGFSPAEMQISPGISGTAAVASLSLDKIGIYAPSCEKLKSKLTLGGGCPFALQKQNKTCTLFWDSLQTCSMMQNKHCCETAGGVMDLHTKQTKVCQHPQHCSWHDFASKNHKPPFVWAS